MISRSYHVFNTPAHQLTDYGRGDTLRNRKKPRTPSIFGHYAISLSSISATIYVLPRLIGFSFSHNRVTIPPSGWISSAHRQGVKILGTLYAIS